VAMESGWPGGGRESLMADCGMVNALLRLPRIGCRDE
jgi:hypothetical protein